MLLLERQLKETATIHASFICELPFTSRLQLGQNQKVAHKTQVLAIDHDLCHEVLQVIYALSLTQKVEAQYTYQNMTAGLRTQFSLRS